MAEHAEVFISGTTRDLGTYRREIKDALFNLQIFPIEESNFALDVARELKKPLYLFLATENYEPDKLPIQSDEEKELQLTHRRAIEQCGDIYYQFTGREELGSRIRELRFPGRSAEAPRRVVNLPYNSLGPLFKGRDAALADLRRRLGSCPCQAIHGLGGVGKRASQSNMRGAMRATTRRCSLLVLALRLICARTSPGSVIRWSLTSRSRLSQRKPRV